MNQKKNSSHKTEKYKQQEDENDEIRFLSLLKKECSKEGKKKAKK